MNRKFGMTCYNDKGNIRGSYVQACSAHLSSVHKLSHTYAHTYVHTHTHTQLKNLINNENELKNLVNHENRTAMTTVSKPSCLAAAKLRRMIRVRCPTVGEVYLNVV